MAPAVDLRHWREQQMATRREGGGEDFLLAGIDGEVEGLEGEIGGGGGDFYGDRSLTVAAR